MGWISLSLPVVDSSQWGKMTRHTELLPHCAYTVVFTVHFGETLLPVLSSVFLYFSAMFERGQDGWTFFLSMLKLQFIQVAVLLIGNSFGRYGELSSSMHTPESWKVKLHLAKRGISDRHPLHNCDFSGKQNSFFSSHIRFMGELLIFTFFRVLYFGITVQWKHDKWSCSHTLSIFSQHTSSCLVFRGMADCSCFITKKSK